MLPYKTKTCWREGKTTGLIVKSQFLITKLRNTEKSYCTSLSSVGSCNIRMIIPVPTVIPVTGDNTDRVSHSRCSGRVDLFLAEAHFSRGFSSGYLMPPPGHFQSLDSARASSGASHYRSHGFLRQGVRKSLKSKPDKAVQPRRKSRREVLGWKPEKPAKGGRWKPEFFK